MTRRYTDNQMLAELRRVANGEPLSRPQFIASLPAISAPAITARFGSWMKALATAGLESPFRFGGIWHACPICGEQFRTDNSAKSRRTCGKRACSTESKWRKTFKGDRASASAARGRAARLVEARTCERCGRDRSEMRLERHHRDENIYNNGRANIEVLCLCCHKGEHRARRKAKKLAARAIELTERIE